MKVFEDPCVRLEYFCIEDVVTASSEPDIEESVPVPGPNGTIIA